MDRPHALIAALLLACADAPPTEGGALLLVDVVSAPGATGEGFGRVEHAVNGVRGGGRWQGGLDVFGLRGEELVLSVPEPVRDGDGPELAVFENPFDITNGGGRFMDPAVVEVSADCERFVAFPHAYLASDPTSYDDDPSSWVGFAGVGPVALDVDLAPFPPLDPVAGGDRFDLAELDGEDGDSIREQGFACVRVTSATTWTDPTTGLPYPADPVSDGADIDGIYVRAP